MGCRRQAQAALGTIVMKSAVIILSMVAAIAAEAPYHLPRPAAHAPALGYPAPHPHHRPQPYFMQYSPQPAPQFIQNTGYRYQQPNIAPAFVQPAPQPQISYPQQQYSQPQPQYAQPFPQQIPQGPQPSFTYGQPQLHQAPAPRPHLPTFPIQPFITTQPQTSPIIQPISYHQPQLNSQQGYSYQQPQVQDAQYTSQLPLQAQSLGNNAALSTLSSYQADSNQYSGSTQVHSEALDSTVVGRLQNIITENEHTSARDAGYVSLVSGVSLEGAKPSIEISSFVQNSPLSVSSGQSSPSHSSQSSAASSAPAQSQAYAFPTVAANSQTTSHGDSSTAFLPQNKPVTSYGSPQ